MKPNQIEKIKAEYERLKGSMDSFGVELTRQIDHLLKDAEVTLGFPIEFRTKTWESIEQKLSSFSIKSIKDMQDVCGFRLILLFPRDVETVKDLIREHFTIEKEYDTHDRLETDQFGYSSFHYVVRMPDHWLKTPTLKNHAGLIAEIQIRTLAQHIWAAASHVLQYKTPQNVPKSMLRSIYRLSAILELVDVEFERFLDEREKYIEQLERLTPAQTKTLTLDVNLLEKILDEYFPARNKIKGHENYSQLLNELRFFKIATVDAVVALIKKHLKAALQEDIDHAQKDAERSGTESRGYYFKHVGLLRSCLGFEYGEDYLKMVRHPKK